MYVHMYVCICMYVHRYVHTYVCCKLLLQKGNLLASKDFLCTYVHTFFVHTYIQTDMCAHTSTITWKMKIMAQKLLAVVFIYNYIHTYMHTNIHTYTQSCICGHASVQTYVPYMYLLCTCIHTHTYIHTYIHTLHTYTLHKCIYTHTYKSVYRMVQEEL